MYIRIVFIILLLDLISLFSFSQEYQYVPFPNSNAIWSEIYYPPITYGETTYERFALSGEDTIINMVGYKKLYLFYDTIFNIRTATYIGGIREDFNKKVFYIGSEVLFLKPSYTQIINDGGEKGDEIQLYDFSLNEGDTFSYGNLSKPYEYLVVTNIDTLLFNNSYRKVLHFQPIWWVTWIEGIGSSKGLLFTSGDLPTNGIDNDLICFKNNDTIYYFNNNYDDCIPLITHIDINKSNTSIIKVFPNPSENHGVTFVLPDITFKSLEIFDCKGVLKDRKEINLQSELTISLQNYLPGTYIYSIVSSLGTSYYGKFIVD